MQDSVGTPPIPESPYAIHTRRLLNSSEAEKRVGSPTVKELLETWSIPIKKLKFGPILGKGAYKIVYKGRYLGSDVAIGQITNVDQSDFHLLEKELRILQNIRHPNCLLFIGVAYDSNAFNIVTELAPHGSLTDLLKDHPELTWKTKLRGAEEIAMALMYLHERNIYHRDLKADNVLVFPGDNDGYLMKVADFGLGFLQSSDILQIPEAKEPASPKSPSLKHAPALANLNDLTSPLSRSLAKILTGETDGFSPEARLALARSKVGTIWIRAPEVDNATQYQTGAVDIFSFGMILIEFLTQGQAEDVRWEVTYQKKDAEGNTLLAFGIDSGKMRELLTRKCTTGPEELIELAIQCCDEDPAKRPSLDNISTTLKKLRKRYERKTTLQRQLSMQQAKRDTRAMQAAVSLHDPRGEVVWGDATSQSHQDRAPTEKVWEHVLSSPTLPTPFTEQESEFLRCLSEFKTLGDQPISLGVFSAWWGTSWAPVLDLCEHLQLKWFLKKFMVNAFLSRQDAQKVLNKHGTTCIILRLSSTIGKMTVSYVCGNKIVHQTLALDEHTVVLGVGKGGRVFNGLLGMLTYFKDLGYSRIYCRDKNCHSLEKAIENCAIPDEKLLEGYELTDEYNPTGE